MARACGGCSCSRGTIAVLGLLSILVIAISYTGIHFPQIEPPTCAFPELWSFDYFLVPHTSDKLPYKLYQVSFSSNEAENRDSDSMSSKRTGGCTLCGHMNTHDSTEIKLNGFPLAQLATRRPIIFVHGSAGHYSQARFLVNAFFERQENQTSEIPVDMYSIDFLEELSAFSASVLRRQADYFNSVVSLLTSAYGVSKIDIVAHSMGGVVARLATTLAEHPQPSPLRVILTLASPHAGSPLPISVSMQNLYVELTSKWQDSSSILVSLYGGTLDNQVSPALTQVSGEFAIAAPSAAISGFGTACCHQSISYCPILMSRLVDALMFDDPREGRSRQKIMDHIQQKLFSRAGQKNDKVIQISSISLENGQELVFAPQIKYQTSWTPRIWWASYQIDLKASSPLDEGEVKSCSLKATIAPKDANYTRELYTSIPSKNALRVYLHAMAPNDVEHNLTLMWDCPVAISFAPQLSLNLPATMMRFSREYALVSAVSQPFGLFYLFLGLGFVIGVFQKNLAFPKFTSVGNNVVYGIFWLLIILALVLSWETASEKLFTLLKVAACVPRPSLIQGTLAIYNLAEKIAAIIVNSFVSLFILGAIIQATYLLGRCYNVYMRSRRTNQIYMAVDKRE